MAFIIIMIIIFIYTVYISKKKKTKNILQNYRLTDTSNKETGRVHEYSIRSFL